MILRIALILKYGVLRASFAEGLPGCVADPHPGRSPAPASREHADVPARTTDTSGCSRLGGEGRNLHRPVSEGAEPVLRPSAPPARQRPTRPRRRPRGRARCRSVERAAGAWPPPFVPEAQRARGRATVVSIPRTPAAPGRIDDRPSPSLRTGSTDARGTPRIAAPSGSVRARDPSSPRSNRRDPEGRAMCPPLSPARPVPPRPARRRGPPSPRSCGRWCRPLRRVPRTRSRRPRRRCTGQPRAGSEGRHDPPALDRRDRQRSLGPHGVTRPPFGCSRDQPRPAPRPPGMRRRAMPGSGIGRGTQRRSARPERPASAGASPPTREPPTGRGSGRGATRTRGAAAGTTSTALPAPRRADYASPRRRMLQCPRFEMS